MTHHTLSTKSIKDFVLFKERKKEKEKGHFFQRSCTIRNFAYASCFDYTVPIEQSLFCNFGVTEDSIVTSCGGARSTASTVGDVTFCYILDCTNTDIGVVCDDCYWTDTSPIYNEFHSSAGCEESCEICPGEGAGTAAGGDDVIVDVETFAANGSYTCDAMFEFGLNGSLSIDECVDLQTTLPGPCGCSSNGQSSPDTSNGMESTPAPSAATSTLTTAYFWSPFASSMLIGGGGAAAAVVLGQL